ncbi:hypothetical protein [Streptomyces mexicanus]|jgi:hypothetical protein|uniref:hypothetical protein n=1 Tax=Streptomyces mexicanus TaxID=178566 RepID=UPI003668E4BB
MSGERYRLTLAAGGRPVMQGRWASEVTALRKFSGWIGEFGNLHGVRITLVDEETGETVTTWPEEE